MRRLLLIVALLALSGSGIVVAQSLSVAPGNEHFQRNWERTDKPVIDGQAVRTWMWSPEAFTAVMQEPYAESPNGMRDVQYFDKARMEITRPTSGDPASIWYVTNGLLTVELITGRVQLGDATFEDRDPAQVNVAGDADDANGPTYATFETVLDAPALPIGTVITQRIARSGEVTNDPALFDQGVSVAISDDVTSHGIATPFWEFMTSSGVVYEDGQFITDLLFENPYFATGRPITEAYWANVKVAGTQRDVLMQCFERRCLTYTPGNPEGFVVEAGNVGQHYYQWRYSGPPSVPPAEPSPTATAEPVPTDEILYQSNLSDWPAVTSPLGDRGVPGDASYHIHNEPELGLYIFGDQAFADARVTIQVRRVAGSENGLACLVTRGEPYLGVLSDHGYHFCAVYSEGQLIGVSAQYLWFDTNEDLHTDDLGVFPLTPRAQGEWITLEITMDGPSFEFAVDGQHLGGATHDRTSSGRIAIMAFNLGEFSTSDTEFTNLIVYALGDDGSPPPAEPTATPTTPPQPPSPTATPTEPPTENCHASYPDFCIPPPPPDLNCDDPEIGGETNFTVLHNVPNPDPHDLDGDRNGVGCQS